jgi:hypothetical protein
VITDTSVKWFFIQYIHMPVREEEIHKRASYSYLTVSVHPGEKEKLSSYRPWRPVGL